MKDFINQNFFAIVVLGFLFWFVFLKPKDNSEVIKIQNQNAKLSLQVDSLKSLITAKLGKIDSLEIHKNFITNKYYYESQKVDSVNNSDSLHSIIREQLDRLGSARFDK